MQCIKMKSTLRIGPKNKKKAPRIVKRIGEQDEQIRDFLKLRNEVKKHIRDLLILTQIHKVCVVESLARTVSRLYTLF